MPPRCVINQSARALIAGKFDWIFLGNGALVRLLGAPAADNKEVMFETGHDVSEQRAGLFREVIGRLDQYPGDQLPTPKITGYPSISHEGVKDRRLKRPNISRAMPAG